MKTPVRNEQGQTITFFAYRDFLDTPIEVAIEVLDYIPEGRADDGLLAAQIYLGDAWTLDGKSFELTELEREAAEEQALRE